MQKRTVAPGVTQLAGLWKLEPVWLLTPERLDDEDAAEQYEADDVNCLSQGGSLAGAARPGESFKPGAAIPRSDGYVDIAGTFIAPYRRAKIAPG
jgi:hypothetical protein